LTPSVPQIDKAQFTTPSARNWEEGGSFESVVEGLNELGLGVMEEEEEGIAEVEWMPPRSERESQAARPSRVVYWAVLCLHCQMSSTGHFVLPQALGIHREQADDSFTAYPNRRNRLRSRRIQDLRYIARIMAFQA